MSIPPMPYNLLRRNKNITLHADDSWDNFLVLNEPPEGGEKAHPFEYRTRNPRKAFLAYQSYANTRDLAFFEGQMAERGFDPITGKRTLPLAPLTHTKPPPWSEVTCLTCLHGPNGNNTCPSRIPNCINGTPLQQEG